MAKDETIIDGNNPRGFDGPIGRIDDIEIIRPVGAFDRGNAPSGGNDGAGGEPKRRGRPPGSRNGSSEKASSAPNLGRTPAAPIKPGDIAPAIMVVHMLLAAKLAPEMAMTQPEADQLAEAICNYLRHTKIKMDAKTRDFWALMIVLGSVEGTRLLAFVTRRAREAKQAALVKEARARDGKVVAIDPTGQFAG